MSMQKPEGMISYRNVNESYLRRRQLRGSASPFLLWGLGVGAVISGDFYGWNYGLAAGGFWGLAIATFLMAIMYLCMVSLSRGTFHRTPPFRGFVLVHSQRFWTFLGSLFAVSSSLLSMYWLRLHWFTV
jgi:ethanolamine permease